MIPKRIIYCWFGGGKKPENVQNCINSWHEQMSDWEFLEINENNFDVNYNQYCKDAYNAKKWAYVSDVARLWSLYTYGGVYMDTDVFVYKPLDKFLVYDFFTGFEQINYPVTATMGAKQNDELVKEMLDIYNNKIFLTHDNWGDYETNTMIMSDIIGKYFNRQNMTLQLKNNRAIFPREVFCWHDKMTENVYTKHLMFGSWAHE